MLITVTNISTDQVPINTIYKTLEVAEAITFSRTAAQIDAELQLKQLIVDGLVSVSFEDEATDIGVAPQAAIASYSNATRPSASDIPTYSMIFNTSDNQINISDGTNWRDPSGAIT